MDRVDYESLVVQELINLEKSGELDINPWYQRRSVWLNPQKSYLINTIFSGKPVPTIYIRHRLDIEREKTTKEVVDGQQRIRAILEFRKGDFSVRHPITRKRAKFSDLSKNEKESFLMTKLSIGYLVGASDADVIDIFGRINSVSKTLNDQEKRNAAFSGEFKQFCLSEASKRVNLWRDLKLFTANDIARMQEVKFVSELALNMLKGLTDASVTALNKIYKEYDEEFPHWVDLEKRFDHVFGVLSDVNNVRIADTIFSRQPLFFSLFLVVDELKRISSAKVGKAIAEIEERFQSDTPVNERVAADAEFYLASTSTTQRIAQRRARNKYIKSFLK